jgi:NTP pyrophosphatase (non-canonical NTP hydrolase)
VAYLSEEIGELVSAIRDFEKADELSILEEVREEKLDEADIPFFIVGHRPDSVTVVSTLF